MAIDYTVNSIIDGIKRRAAVPGNQQLFNTDDFVDIINEELQTVIVPLMKSVIEEYFITSSDITVTAGTSSYEIPTSAFGAALRDVTVLRGSDIISIPRFTLEEVSSRSVGRSAFGRAGFYIQDNNIIIFPSPNTGATLRVFYERRPNKLVKTNQCAQVVSINTGTNEVTCSFVPTSWTTSTSVDIIKSSPHFGNIFENQTIAAINGFTIELPDVTGISVNDWLSETGTSPIPQAPPEAHELLKQAGSIYVLMNQDDSSALQVAGDKYKQMKEHFLTAITPRVREPKKVVSSNSITDYTSRNRNWGWWGY